MKPNQTRLFSQLFDVVCFWHGILQLGIALLQGVSNWHFFIFPLRCPRMVVCDLQLQMPGTAVLFWDERTKRDETAG
jgi:hypothetical protein